MTFDQWSKYFNKLVDLSKDSNSIIKSFEYLFGGFDGKIFNLIGEYEDIILDLLSLNNSYLKEDIIYVIYDHPKENAVVHDKENNILYNANDINSFINYVKQIYF